MTKPIRTKITREGNSVTVTREDPVMGGPTTTEYFVPSNGGYVRERDDAGRYPQVCQRLSPTGSTLSASPDTLETVIRKELRRRISMERRN